MSATNITAPPQVPVPSEDTLRTIAEYFHHLQEVESGRRTRDPRGEAAILDHIGLNRWLDACRWAPGGIPNTRYLHDRRWRR